MTAGTDFQTGKFVLTTGAQLDDTMQIGIDTGGAEVAVATVGAIAQKVLADSLATLPISKLSTMDGTATIQVGGLTGAQINNLTVTGTVAPFSIYTPQATEIIAAAALAGLGVGSNFIANIANLRTTTGIGTLTGSSGVTVNGLATLTGQNSFGTWNISIDSAAAVTMTRVG